MKEWLKNAIFYEIYPQTFKDSDADGIGDFRGIIEKLDYIGDMGFNGIWINPCFESPFYDAGYDIEDFYHTAPRYGTNEDLKHVFEEAHRRGIKVLLDLVPGHTAVTHKWLSESMKSEHNEFTDRYVWTDDMNTNRDKIKNINGFIAGFSQRMGALAVNYFTTQPALNYGFAKVTEPWQFAVDSDAALATRDELINIMKFWLGMGCDGFRVDMANFLVKADDDDASANKKLWNDIFKIIRAEFPEAVFISEWGIAKQAISGGFDMDFTLHNEKCPYNDLFKRENCYFSVNPDVDEKWFNAYLDNYKETNGKGLMCFFSGNHDVRRASLFLDDIEMRLMYAFILSMPGAPFIYNGDEIGMRYVDGLKSVEGSYTRTGSRTPMQWDDTVNNGFSAAKSDELYIPMDSSDCKPTVKDQAEDKHSLLNEVKKLIKIRKENEPLQSYAEFIPVNFTNKHPLVYVRKGNTGSILVAINPSDKLQECDCKLSVGDVIYSYGKSAIAENGKITVPPLSASYMTINSK